jgi:transketolase
MRKRPRRPSPSRWSAPTLLALTRQSVPDLQEIPASIRRAGTLRGAYIAVQETAPLTHILLASGSEVQYALAAAKELGAGTRVLSVPSFEIFNRQPPEYREGILPSSCRKRAAIEAGVGVLWRQYVGLEGKIVSIERFGLSAPAPQVFKELGITTEALIAAARSL